MLRRTAKRFEYVRPSWDFIVAVSDIVVGDNKYYTVKKGQKFMHIQPVAIVSAKQMTTRARPCLNM